MRARFRVFFLFISTLRGRNSLAHGFTSISIYYRRHTFASERIWTVRKSRLFRLILLPLMSAFARGTQTPSTSLASLWAFQFPQVARLLAGRDSFEVANEILDGNDFEKLQLNIAHCTLRATSFHILNIPAELCVGWSGCSHRRCHRHPRQYMNFNYKLNAGSGACANIMDFGRAGVRWWKWNVRAWRFFQFAMQAVSHTVHVGMDKLNLWIFLNFAKCERLTLRCTSNAVNRIQTKLLRVGITNPWSRYNIRSQSINILPRLNLDQSS